MGMMPALTGLMLLALSAAGASERDPATGALSQSARLLEKADPLPLALDDAFEFRKTKLFLNDPQKFKPTTESMLSFERLRLGWKAVSGQERNQRQGNYFTFFWRSQREADLKVRLEYRQERLGDYVQAQEVEVPHAKGSFKTEFQVIGDDYFEDGRVIAWRALLIENGRIVGLTQSYLWN